MSIGLLGFVSLACDVAVAGIFLGRVWNSLHLKGLAIPVGDRQIVLDKLSEETRRVGYQPVVSGTEQLIFRSPKGSKMLTVTPAEGSVLTQGPPEINAALKTIFPQAVERPLGSVKFTGVAVNLGMLAALELLMTFAGRL